MNNTSSPTNTPDKTGSRPASTGQLLEALREWVDDPVSCASYPRNSAPRSGCDCWACERTRKAIRLTTNIKLVATMGKTEFDGDTQTFPLLINGELKTRCWSKNEACDKVRELGAVWEDMPPQLSHIPKSGTECLYPRYVAEYPGTRELALQHIIASGPVDHEDLRDWLMDQSVLVNSSNCEEVTSIWLKIALHYGWIEKYEYDTENGWDGAYQATTHGIGRMSQIGGAA